MDTGRLRTGASALHIMSELASLRATTTTERDSIFNSGALMAEEGFELISNGKSLEQ